MTNIFEDPYIKEIINQANEFMEQGAMILFKITCEGCNERFTANIPNGVFTEYLHEDCGYITQTIDGNLGFAILFGT